MRKNENKSHIDRNPHLTVHGRLARRYFLRIRILIGIIILLLALGVWMVFNYYSILLLFAFFFLILICYQKINSIYPLYKEAKIVADLNKDVITKIKQVSTHDEALKILGDYNNHGIPFCLFLRSFEIESYDILTPVGTGIQGAPRTIINSWKPPGDVEMKLGKVLKDRMRIIAISNPSNIRGDELFIFPRLEVLNEIWEQQVEMLIEHSSMIIFDCHALAPGVVIELDVIKRLNKSDQTVLIIPENFQTKEDSDPSELILKSFHAETVHYPIPRKESIEISGFNRVVYFSEIPLESLDSYPIFSDLLKNIGCQDEIKKENYKKKYRKLRDKDAFNTDSNNFVVLEKIFLEMLQIANELQDKDAQAESFYLLGLACQKGKNWERSIDYLLKSIHISETSEEKGNIEDARLKLIASLYYQGIKYLDNNDNNKAVESLSKAYELADKRNDKALYEKLIYYLSIALGKAGRTEEAIKSFKSCISISKELHNDERTALSYVNIGHLLLKANRIEESLIPLNEAFNYHKDFGNLSERIYTVEKLIEAYTILKNDTKRLELFKILLTFYEKKGAPEKQIECLQQIGLIYMQLNEYLPAIKTFESSIAINKQIGDHNNHCISLVLLGKSLLLSKQTEKARERFQEAILLFDNVDPATVKALKPIIENSKLISHLI